MGRSRFFTMAFASLVMVLLAATQIGYAQSQYRRGNNGQSNSAYRPDNRTDNKKQQAQSPQVQKPSYQHKPQQGNRPPQQSTRPQQGNRPPQQSARPQQSNRPPQQSARPQQGNRPPQQSARPQQGNRPPQYGSRPSGRPGNVTLPPPPPNHYKPAPRHYPAGFRPRPSVHFYGYYRHTLPFGAKVIHRGPYDYYYVDGRYYRYINKVYVICRPPVGAVIARSLLDGVIALTNYAIRDAYGRTQRYYTDNDGLYYIKSGNNYVVVDPPIGAIVYELPYGFEEVTINGTKYYKVDDNFYELIYNGPEDYYFRVVGTLGR